VQSHGSDRVREVAGGRVILFSRYPKNWQPRIAKTHTSAEHPGTAIFWDDAIYEVVAADLQLQGEGVRYVLEPWREEHAIRVTDRYDEESEAGRIHEHQARIARERKRKATTLVGFLAGHLPALVQEELAGELGMFAHRMTLLSAVSMFVVIVALFYAMAQQVMNDRPVEPWQIILTVFLSVETVIRAHLAWAQNRAMGSLIGVLIYSIAYAAGWKRGMTSPLQEAKGNAIYVREETADAQRRDAFHVREPLITLLSPAEQAAFAERFDYDYRRASYSVASIFLVFSAAGVFSSLHKLGTDPGVGAFLSLVSAFLIALEQLLRLSAFKRGPAGSVLGVFVRPFVKRLM
jgi:hypothetical protein